MRELVDATSAPAGTTPSSSASPSSGTRNHEILTHAAAWRLLDLEREQRPRRRSRHRDEVPDLLRASPEQGRLADPPASRGVRAGGHAVQRLRRTPTRTSRCAITSSRSTPRCSANAGGVFANARNTASRAARFNGLDGRAALPPAAPRAAAAPRPGRALPALGRTARSGQARRPGDPCDGARPGGLSLRIAGTGTAGAELEALAESLGPDEPRPVPRRGERRRNHRPLCRRPRGNLSPVR